MGRPPTINREQILMTARAVFTEKGFAAGTLADIATELNVTAAAVLRHFDSKQALFDSAMRGSVALPDCILRLERVDGSADPRVVLRHLAEEWIPFASTTVAQNLVVTMHARSNPTFILPFDPQSDDSPPRRGLRIVANYFKRAKRAGVIHAGDPRAAALLFMGSLLSYVFIHYVLRIFDPPYPVGDYVDSLLDLWTEGAISRAEAQPPQAHHRGVRDRRGRDRPPGLHAGKPPREGARPVRDARSADGADRVARRRTRHPRVRR
ncbi:MAG TPA: TetR/AcrR family transcriptional regulator [Thermoanaerobaculia bacterium]|nr:TetR/AcrR family transcriptional regulator [Thermoanaerobaculia bacterium]